jgi:YggT family protein
MATVYKEVRSDTVEEAPVTTERQEYGMNVAARIVYFLGGLLISLLAVRFLLSLLGANASAGFADFIYTITYPFVAPFFGLFSYDVQYGVSKFELGTLIAIVVYAIATALLGRLVTIGSRRSRPV